MEEESISAGYFNSICFELLLFKHTTWAVEDRIQQLLTDVRFLGSLCSCIETWKGSINDENEEMMERLTSVITCLQGIWPKDFASLLSLLLERMGGSETCPDDFDSVMSELEGTILRSKQLVEGWSQNSLLSSKFVTFLNYSSRKTIEENLSTFYYIGGKTVPLKKQIGILRAKLKFLNFMAFPDGEEINEVLNFVHHFAYCAAFVTFLYWAKEDNHETASEMDTVLFAMLNKFIPYAYHTAPLYFAILKSDNLQPISSSFLLGEAVETFVDFFFDHLTIVLKDDFLFLRDRLMFLFTFLMNPSCENIAGGDLIRSQIYAILHKDVFLLLSFDETEKDFAGEKALFSGFMNRIDVLNAKIRQLYCGSLDSWITLEVEKMDYKYFVSLHRELSSVEKHAKEAVMEQIQSYKLKLRFLRVFLLWLATWDDADEEIMVKLRSTITSFREIWGEKEEEGLLAHRLHAIPRGSITDWHPLAYELQGKIHQSKLLQTEACRVNMFHSSFPFKTSPSYKILEFLDSILHNLNDLVNYKASEIAPFKKQIQTLEEKLIFLKNFLKLALSCVYFEEWEEFKTFIQAFANDAACLTFLYCEKEVNAERASETNSILSHILRKIKPATLDVARLYFGTLMAICVERSEPHMFGQIAFSFVQLLLGDLVTHLKDEDFQILQDNIVFLLTFLNDPISQNQSIYSQIDALFWEGLYNLLPFDDHIKGGSSNTNVLLSEFMTKIEAINAKIRYLW